MKRYTNILRAMLTLPLLFALSSCGSSIFEKEGDCEVRYLLNFRYDMNMKWADAFPSEVNSVRLHVYDTKGDLVWSVVESGEALSKEGYCIELPLKPGKYTFQAWCGADNNPGDEHFTIGDGAHGINGLDCKMIRDHEGNKAISDRNLHDLYYGRIDLELQDYSSMGGVYTYTMPLMKDTNTIRVLLQQTTSYDLDVNDFTFTITDANGWMDSGNSLLDDEQIEYRPYQTANGVVDIIEKNPVSGEGASSQVQVAMAEFALSRLMLDHKDDMYLTITNKADGKVVLSIPLVKFVLLVKGFERQDLDDQEYLDRQDEYSMVFFINYGKWIASSILVNSWRVVLQDQELGS